MWSGESTKAKRILTRIRVEPSPIFACVKEPTAHVKQHRDGIACRAGKSHHQMIGARVVLSIGIPVSAHCFLISDDLCGAEMSSL